MPHTGPRRHGNDRHSLALGRVHGVRAGDAGARPRRLSPQSARGPFPRGAHLERRLGGARPHVQRADLDVVRPDEGPGVPDGLPHREGPVGGQHLRLPGHLLLLLGAGGLSAPGAVLGHSRRPGHARDFHRGRRGAHHEVPLDHLRVRRSAPADRRQAVRAAERAHAAREEPGAPAVQALRPHGSRVPRAAVHGRDRRAGATPRRCSPCSCSWRRPTWCSPSTRSPRSSR